jgi:hypothetical protein
MNIDNTISSLVTARRLMVLAQEMEDERNGKKTSRKTARDTMEEDQAILSGEQPGEPSQTNVAQNPAQKAIG